MDVGEGQKQTRCIDSPVRRRGGVESSENGVALIIARKYAPSAYIQNRTDPTHHRAADAPRWCSQKEQLVERSWMAYVFWQQFREDEFVKFLLTLLLHKNKKSTVQLRFYI
jgi:hypothetical protein